jgi:hypothetical protein
VQNISLWVNGVSWIFLWLGRKKHHPPRHFDIWLKDRGGQTLDGNPVTRLTGHPIPVTLVSGKFFYLIFLFWRKFIFSNFFNNFLSVSFSLSPSLSLFVCTHSLGTFEIATCRQKDFTGRSDCVGKTEPVVGWWLFLTRTTTQVVFEECWNKASIRNGPSLPPRISSRWRHSMRCLWVLWVPDRWQCNPKSSYTYRHTHTDVHSWYTSWHNRERQHWEYCIVLMTRSRTTLIVLSPPECSNFLKQPGYQHILKVLPTKAPDCPYSVNLSRSDMVHVQGLWCHVLSVCVWSLLLYRGMDSLSKHE